jgi:hypothetical protein
MGMIQSSFNHLILSAIGTVGSIGGVAYGFKKGLEKPEAPAEKQPQAEQPKAETSSGMGNIAKIGRDYSRTNSRSYMAAAKAVDSGNDMISQKARAKFIPLEKRLALIKEASNISVLPEKKEKKGGSK